jgi:undecaprenyl-diphosphatase
VELTSTHRRRLTLIVLASLLVAVAACLAAFHQPASVFSRLDESIIRAVGALRATRWNVSAIDLTALGGYTILTIYIAFATMFLMIVGLWRDGLQMLLTGLGADVLQMWLKGFYMRERPALAEHLVVVDGFSFPSGHSLAAAAVFLGTGLLARHLVAPERRLARATLVAAMVVIAVVVGGTRVYLGVHWPTDVVGGLCIGWAWALLMEAALAKR